MMLFTLGQPHYDPETKEPRKATFFGYFKDDAHKKKKNLGRIEQFDVNNVSKWKSVEEKMAQAFTVTKRLKLECRQCTRLHTR